MIELWIIVGLFIGFPLGHFFGRTKKAADEAYEIFEEPPLHKLRRIWHGKDWPKR